MLSKKLLPCLLMLAGLTVAAQEKPLLVNSGKVIEDGARYHDEGKYDKALKKYQQVAESDTNYALALYEIAITAMAQKNYAEAIEAASKGLELKSSLKPSLVQQLGNAYSSNHQLDKAIETYHNGLKEFPYYFRFYYEMGAACLNNDKPREALLYLDSCLRINFGYARAHYLMGYICQQNNQFVPALLSYQMASYLDYEGDIGLTSLKAIEKIATGETSHQPKDSIQPLWGKGENSFDEVDEIIRSKGELVDGYKVKPAVKLPFTTVIKCLHLLNSRLATYADGRGWYIKTLLPIFTDWWSHKEFPLMLYRMCSVTETEESKKMYAKNKAAIEKMHQRYFETFVREKQTYPSRMEGLSGKYLHLFIYQNYNLYAFFPATEPYTAAKGVTPQQGHYVYYQANGFMEKQGDYTGGNESGVWLYYDKTGTCTTRVEFIGKGEFRYTNYHPNGQPKSKGHMKDGASKGNLELFHYNGMPEQVVPLDDKGQIHGKAYVYYNNGQLHYIKNFKSGKLVDGEELSYYQSGALKNKENFKAEKKHGLVNHYYEDGTLKLSGQFANGDRTGKWVEYHPNGKVSAEYTYVNNEYDGMYKTWHQNGQLSSECTYANGVEKGQTKQYDTDGKLFAEYTENKGKIKRAIYYDKDGKVIYDGGVAKGTLKLLKYNSLGIKTEEGDVEKDFRTGPWKFYYNNGALSTTQTYDSKGLLQGQVEKFYVGGATWKKYNMVGGESDGYYAEYYMNGAKKVEGNYVNGTQQGLWREYWQTGKLSEEYYMLNGDITGFYKFFYPNGKLHFVEEYRDGDFVKYSLYDTSGIFITSDTLGIEAGNIQLERKPGSPHISYNYLRGKKHGPQTHYWANKQPKMVINYTMGRKESEKQFHPNGNQKQDNAYKYGEPDSVSRRYDEQGRLEYTRTFRFGEASGPEKYYYPDGKVETQGELLEGDREGWYEYYTTGGQLQYKLFYHLGIELGYSYTGKDGKPVQMIPFKEATGEFTATFANGVVSAKGSFVNGSRHGMYTRYHANGKKAEEGTYVNDDRNGIYTEYFENGKVKLEVNFVYGNKDGIEKLYDANGQLVQETTWLDDHKNGPERYYKAGRLVKTINYFFDNTYDR